MQKYLKSLQGILTFLAPGVIVVITFMIVQRKEVPQILNITSTEESQSLITMQQADQLFLDGNYERALAMYNGVIKSGQELETAYAGRGNMLMNLRRFGEAAEDYTKALTFKRTSEVLANRCIAYRMLSRNDEAKKDCDESVRLNPESVEAHAALAAFYMGEGEFEKARDEVDVILKIDPNSANAYFIISQIELSQGSAEKAVEALTKSIELDPTNPRYYWERGFLYYSLAKIEESKADMKKVMEVGKPESDGEVMYRASTLLMSFGETP